MIAILILFACVTLYGVRLSAFHDDYIGRETTTSVKGVFAVLILLSHIRGYVTLDMPGDALYDSIIKSIGQLMVAMYFFYSGYGILEAYRRKTGYVDTFLRRRILKTLTHFCMAVALFVVAETAMGHYYPARHYLLCWVGWESVGNSNWFVFDILALYLLTFVAMVASQRSGVGEKALAAMVTVLTALLWVAMVWAGRGYWWFDTLFCFPTGMWYSLVKPRVEIAMRRRSRYIVAVALLMALFVACRMHRHAVAMTVMEVAFAYLLVLVTMKVSVGNKALHWLGVNAFSIYILQRLPMNVMAECGLNGNSLRFALVVIPLVMVMAWLFTKATDRIDNRYFR